MEANVQWFDPALGTPVVSVSATGLTFNRAAVALLGHPRYIEVGVDAKACAIVVRKADENEGGAAPARGLPFCRPDAGSPFVRVASKELLRFIASAVPDFPLGTAAKFLARFEPERGALLVDLRQPMAAPRRRKRGSAAPVG